MNQRFQFDRKPENKPQSIPAIVKTVMELRPNDSDRDLSEKIYRALKSHGYTDDDIKSYFTTINDQGKQNLPATN